MILSRHSKEVHNVLLNMSMKQQKAFMRDYRSKRKSVFVAYLAYFFFGFHYLYFDKGATQIFFYLTCGFFVIGYLVDFFRLPFMVRKINLEMGRQIAKTHLALGNYPDNKNFVNFAPGYKIKV